MYGQFIAAIGKSVFSMLLIQAVRPDRLLAASHRFVDAVMGAQFMPDAEKVLDLDTVVENEVLCIYFLCKHNNL